MIKEIKFGSITAVPTDYECPDGDLSVALNVVNEGGSLRPSRQPEVIFSLPEGMTAIATHDVPGQRNYIIKGFGTPCGLYYATGSSETDEDGVVVLSLPFGMISGFISVSVIGNTIAVATESGMNYFLWNNGAYVSLGEKPDFVPIEFGLEKVNSLASVADTIRISKSVGDYLMGTSSHRPLNDESFSASTEALTNGVMGTFLRNVSDTITTKGYFYMPFMVRYAFRLFDGSYAWHSAPVLMLATAHVPIIRSEITGQTEGSQEYDMQIDLSQVHYFALKRRILSTISQRWKDIITSIDVFASAPLYTYDQSKPIPLTRSKVSVVVQETWTGPRGRRAGGGSATYLDGHYSVYGDNFTDVALSSEVLDLNYALHIPANEKFQDEIRDASAFYKIASIPFDEITASGTFSDLEIDVADMTNLVTRKTLDDDYRSHCSLQATSTFAFNSRLNVALSKLGIADPLPLRSTVAATSGSTQAVTVYVMTKTNGLLCYSSLNDSLGFPSLGSAFPRYIFYPDSTAYRMVIKRGSLMWDIPLVSHDFLNGAYWFGGTGSNYAIASTSFNLNVNALGVLKWIDSSNKIYTSDVNNPFIFPLKGINTVGNGKIIALSSAVQALSQGQFGQFPLYAFTSDGIWSLSVSSDGWYHTVQPVSREVCLGASSILQVDDAVVFATSKGIMMIRGSQTACLSEMLDSDEEFVPSELPSINVLMSGAGVSTDDFSVVDVSSLLMRCGMIYDYVHRSVLVYNTVQFSASIFVYSLENHGWTMLEGEFLDSIPSYPDALAVDSQNRLVRFSDTAIGSDAVIITRPMKLGAPDVLKTVDTLIVRGKFRRGVVKCILYGSRDLIHWFPIRSSADHVMRGFRGTPYKYFRLAIFASLQRGEYISGCSVSFEARLTDILR